MSPYINCLNYGMDFTQENFNESLKLIVVTLQKEKNNNPIYDYLINISPTQEEKQIIISIKKDQLKHLKWLRKIYKYYSGEEIQINTATDFISPNSYTEDIQKLIFRELVAMEQYRIIRKNIPIRFHRDIVYSIITDKLKHTSMYNYILNQHTKDCSRQPNEFTLSELSEYDGTMGKPAYVAVNKIVYDVTNISKWSGGTHYGLTAGKDLTSEFETCHGISNKLKKLPKVGVLKE